MFGFFKKKKESTKVTDLVFRNEEAKNISFANALRSKPDTIVIVWFDECYSRVETLLENIKGPQLFMARQASSHTSINNFLFYGHYPLYSREQDIFEQLSLSEAVFYSSLDEPLFLKFGGEKMVELLDRMGMQSNEAIRHPFISRSIKNAQQKLEKSIVIESPASSSNEWFRKNS